MSDVQTYSSDVAFTPAVKAVQTRKGSRDAYEQHHAKEVLGQQLNDIRRQGLFKSERFLQGPQGSAIRVAGREVMNFCANNYLGLANHPAVVEAAVVAKPCPVLGERVHAFLVVRNEVDDEESPERSGAMSLICEFGKEAAPLVSNWLEIASLSADGI